MKKENNLIHKEINQGLEEFEQDKQKIKKIQGKKSLDLYDHLYKSTTGWSKIWIGEIYKISKERFDEDYILKEIKRCRIFSFMEIKILNALNTYKE